MQTFNIKDFKMGWFIGDFEPTLLRTPAFEIAHHFYPKGFKGEPHIHKVATEYNYVVSGVARVWEESSRRFYYFSRGQGFVFAPHEYLPVEYLEDTNLIIVKTPSLVGDKYPIENNNS